MTDFHETTGGPDVVNLMGDVYLDSAVSAGMVGRGRFILNLEGPITEVAVGVPGKINLKMNGRHFLETFPDPPVAVSLANNHIYDYGRAGYDETRAFLKSHHIRYFGNESCSGKETGACLLETMNKCVAVLGYVCPTTHPAMREGTAAGCNSLATGRVIDDIGNARRKGADRVVLYLHWGDEEVFLPRPADVDKAHAFIDAGADLIVGHHAHRIQAVETYKGKSIFYGIGNCIMPDLNVPARYDAGGQATGVYKKKQRRWNKRSLLISYDALRNTAVVYELHFNKSSLRIVGCGAEKYLMRENRALPYEKMYRRSYFYGKFRRKLFDYLERPRIPRLRNISTVLSLLNRKRG